MSYPENFRYTKEHEWIRVENGVGTVGVTDFAQSELGDVVYVDLPKVGTKIEAGKPFGSVESVKAVSDLFAPVSGEVVETNAALASKSELVNTAPHADGWMIKVKLDNPAAADALLTAADYQKYISEKSH